MKSIFRTFLHAPEFDTCREQIDRENRTAIRLLAVLGLPLSFINAATQLFASGRTMLPRTIWMAVYFLLLLIVEPRISEKSDGRATLRLYLLQAPAMALAILLGTVWDPEHQASTFLLFLMAMPVFLFDRPLRVTAVSAFWSCAFIALCRAAKGDTLFMTDTAHTIEYFFGSTVVVYLVLWTRLRALESLEQTEYLLDHDRQTGCLSRHALAASAERCVGRRLTVLLFDLDRMDIHRDFYGPEAAENILLNFSQTLQDAFGTDCTYRFGEDEILCTVPDAKPEDCAERIASCREALQGYEHGGLRMPLTFSVGCVDGTPATREELQQMVQLADLCTSIATEHGEGQFYGKAFSPEALNDAIAQSSVSSNMRAFEIDSLTGLPNMSFFVTRTDETLANLVDYSRHPVVGEIRLTNLRDFNNRFGYTLGDKLLTDTAALLQRSFEHRLICRITAGTFGIMCYRDEIPAGMRKVCEVLRQYRAGYTVQCAAGFAAYTGNESTISLLDSARIALKNCDRKSGQLYCFYSEAMEAERKLQQYIVEHVDEAIDRGWLQVYYQPIARAVTGEVCNEEALSRWEDPRHGMLMPIRFITTLEENDLMYKVNLNVVRIVLRDFKRRQELGIPLVPVSVNLSRRDFEQHDMVGAITQMVQESGLPCDLLKIEITESAFVANQELLERQVEGFHRNGFEVWMDDFGSEYSTLNLLQNMDFDLIKIDMKFMKNFAAGEKNYIIVSELIDMAKRMGISTLIEGVETPEQFELVRKLGCEKIQGYLFNSPHSFDYIAQRALTGTGLRFEEPDAAPYYEAISRVDLDSPLTLADDFHMSNEMPTGIIEDRDGVFTCLRGNDRFYRMLASWGVLADESARVLLEPLPKAFLDAIRACTDDGRWTNFMVQTADGKQFRLYLRCVSSMHYRGGTALLTVVLPGNDAARE